jgi:hypothetical protein
MNKFGLNYYCWRRRCTCFKWEKVHSFSVLQHVVCIILIQSNLSHFEISDILRVQKGSTRTVTTVRIELHTCTKGPFFCSALNYTMTFSQPHYEVIPSRGGGGVCPINRSVISPDCIQLKDNNLVLAAREKNPRSILEPACVRCLLQDHSLVSSQYLIFCLMFSHDIPWVGSGSTYC